MLKEKIKNILPIIKQNVFETYKLLWQFKWGIIIYWCFYSLFIFEYFNPMERTNPIFGAEETRQYWYYTNYDVYMGNLKNSLLEWALFFLVGTSNMRNHPKIAKFIFFSPIIYAIFQMLINSDAAQIGLIYLLIILGIIGFMLFNLQIIKFYQQQFSTENLYQNKIKYLNIIAKILQIISLFILFYILLTITSPALSLFALCVIMFLGIISYYDFVLQKKTENFITWWQKWNRIDKIYIIAVIVNIVILFFRKNNDIHCILSFNIFWIYLLILKNLKKQNKFTKLFNSPHIKFIETILSQYFYYGSWIVSIVCTIMISVVFIALFIMTNWHYLNN